MHEQLHSDDQLSVFLTIEDDEVLRLEIVSHTDEVDLSIDDDVVIFMDDQPVAVSADDPAQASAELGPAGQLEDTSFDIVMRVHEFFEAWEFGPQ